MKLTVTMSRWEIMPGAIYLIFQLTLLPTLLAVVCSALPFPVNGAQQNFLYFLVNLLAVAAIFHRYLWQSILHMVRHPGKVLGFAAVGLGLYWTANFAMGCLLLWLGMDISNVNDSSIAAMAAQDFPLMLIGTVLLVPLAEETLYRGLLFGTLHGKNKALGYGLSTALFCAIHVVGYIGSYSVDTLLACFVQYIPAGLCLGWVYTKADSIFAPILIHAVVNAIGIYAVR